MLSRLRTHVRHNVVGYLALFFALTGVAYAAGPLKPGDPAGGDLSGTYPNPSIASGAIGTSQLSSTIPAVRATTDQGALVDSGSLVILPFESESYDTAGLHSTSADTSRLTAPVAGVYRVSAIMFWTVNNSSGLRNFGIVKNGGSSFVEASAQTGAASGGSTFTQQVSTDIKLLAGDFVEAGAVQNSGSTLNVLPRSFTMSWVAPG